MHGAFRAPWTVIFGPSGSGKSTLLRIIAGLEEAHSARISVHGRYVTDMAIGLRMKPGSVDRGVGMAMQQAALFPHLTVMRNVAYGLRGSSQAEIQETCEDLLEIVGAAGLANRMPGSLSGGEAQRVALARALAPAPSLLLLDEPLSALDAVARDLVLDRLRKALAERKIQSILVTHDAADALATEAEVVLVRDGRLTAQGPATVVLAGERRRMLERIGGKA
ncbi:MAG TPA: ATP-binding cassette domain-containing protein [Acidobacteriaceae bacterium]